jgi:hypothetical protein
MLLKVVSYNGVSTIRLHSMIVVVTEYLRELGLGHVGTPLPWIV